MHPAHVQKPMGCSGGNTFNSKCRKHPYLSEYWKVLLAAVSRNEESQLAQGFFLLVQSFLSQDLYTFVSEAKEGRLANLLPLISFRTTFQGLTNGVQGE